MDGEWVGEGLRLAAELAGAVWRDFIAYAPAIAGAATTLTALLLWRQDRARRRAERPVFLHRRSDGGGAPVISITAYNPSARHWHVRQARVRTRGVELATYGDKGARDSFNAPVHEQKARGRRVPLDIDLPPNFIGADPAGFTLALLSAKPLPATVTVTFVMYDATRQNWVSRHTATSSIKV